MEPLRIGVLGAARIAPKAIVDPSRETSSRIVAIAARDPERAEAFRDKHGVEKVHSTYKEVLDDPDVEAIYNPLPNGLHGPWNLKALHAGKHVLTEKPSASNTAEARRVHKVAKSAGVVFMEGFHYRYHPVMARMLELIESGRLGELRHIEIQAGGPVTAEDDPRLNFHLAGGALMDVGCYALHATRSFGATQGGEPQLVGAHAVEHDTLRGIDVHMDIHLAFPSGATTRIVTGFDFGSPQRTLRLEGTEGIAFAHDFIAGHQDGRIQILRKGKATVETLGDKTSYTYQLEAFIDAVRNGANVVTDHSDALAQAELIDACYTAAGLPIRPTTKI